MMHSRSNLLRKRLELTEKDKVFFQIKEREKGLLCSLEKNSDLENILSLGKHRSLSALTSNSEWVEESGKLFLVCGASE